MGFRYPHYDAEFGCGVLAIGGLVAIAIPVSRWLPSWAGTSLMAVLLVMLIAWCAWTWYRLRRG